MTPERLAALRTELSNLEYAAESHENATIQMRVGTVRDAYRDLLAEVDRLEQVGRVLWRGLEGLAACVEELRHPSLSPGLRARAADEADEALSTARAALAATEPA